MLLKLSIDTTNYDIGCLKADKLGGKSFNRIIIWTGRLSSPDQRAPSWSMPARMRRWFPVRAKATASGSAIRDVSGLITDLRRSPNLDTRKNSGGFGGDLPRQSLDHNKSLAVKYDGPCACTSVSGVMLWAWSNARRACAGVRFPNEEWGWHRCKRRCLHRY